MLDDLCAGLRERNITLEVGEEVKRHILDKSYRKEYGARPMRRYIERHLEDALAQKLISGELKDGGAAEAIISGDEIVINVK